MSAVSKLKEILISELFKRTKLTKQTIHSDTVLLKEVIPALQCGTSVNNSIYFMFLQVKIIIINASFIFILNNGRPAAAFIFTW